MDILYFDEKTYFSLNSFKSTINKFYKNVNLQSFLFSFRLLYHANIFDITLVNVQRFKAYVAPCPHRKGTWRHLFQLWRRIKRKYLYWNIHFIRITYFLFDRLTNNRIRNSKNCVFFYIRSSEERNSYEIKKIMILSRFNLVISSTFRIIYNVHDYRTGRHVKRPKIMWLA